METVVAKAEIARASGIRIASNRKRLFWGCDGEQKKKKKRIVDGMARWEWKGNYLLLLPKPRYIV